MILMNRKEKKDGDKRYFILDSTGIIHFVPNEEIFLENDCILLPDDVKEEIKSFGSRVVLELIEADNRFIYTHPSQESIKKVRVIAEDSGDLSSLSEIDIQVLALAFDYPGSILISDDYAIQNICSFADIIFKPQSFKIKSTRKYFWKCEGCGEKFASKKTICIECGNRVKRYYKKE